MSVDELVLRGTYRKGTVHGEGVARGLARLLVGRLLGVCAKGAGAGDQEEGDWWSGRPPGTDDSESLVDTARREAAVVRCTN